MRNKHERNKKRKGNIKKKNQGKEKVQETKKCSGAVWVKPLECTTVVNDFLDHIHGYAWVNFPPLVQNGRLPDRTAAKIQWMQRQISSSDQTGESVSGV